MGDACSRLTIHHLRVFLAVAHHRSFTRAADELGLTQAAVLTRLFRARQKLRRALGATTDGEGD